MEATIPGANLNFRKSGDRNLQTVRLSAFSAMEVAFPLHCIIGRNLAALLVRAATNVHPIHPAAESIQEIRKLTSF